MLTDSAKKDGAPRAQLESNLDALNSLVAYCENASECRRTLLLRHFNETFDERQCRGKCDVCAAKAKGAMFEERDVTAAASRGGAAAHGHREDARARVLDVRPGGRVPRPRAAEILKRKYDRLDGYGGAKSANMKAAETHRLLRAMVMRGFFFERSVRSDKGLYSALTHPSVRGRREVPGPVQRARDRASVLPAGRQGRGAQARRGERARARQAGGARRRGRARRPGGPDPGGAECARGGPRVDVFAPATPDPVDDERYEALFDTMYQLRSAIAKKWKDETGQHFAADRVVPLRLLESFARHPPRRSPRWSARSKRRRSKSRRWSS